MSKYFCSKKRYCRFFLFLLFFSLYGSSLAAKPPAYLYRGSTGRSSSGQMAFPASSAQQDAAVRDLQNSVENHEIEIRLFEERIATQETILDALRQQFLDYTLANQQVAKERSGSLEGRLDALEAQVAKVVKEFEAYGKESAKTLSLYREKISELELLFSRMRNGMDTLFAVLQIDAPREGESGGRVHEVKSGDRLEKIAREYKTSVRKIQEANGLVGDKIFSGQKLRIP